MKNEYLHEAREAVCRARTPEELERAMRALTEAQMLAVLEAGEV